ncbi:MAG: KilA-N domain-containing protein, partial [Cellulosilyticaceae bacterium]
MAKNKTGLMTVALCNGFVRADAKTGLICLTDMAKLGEVITGKEVRIQDWRDNKGTKEFIEYVETQQNQGVFNSREKEGIKN